MEGSSVTMTNSNRSSFHNEEILGNNFASATLTKANDEEVAVMVGIDERGEHRRVKPFLYLVVGIVSMCGLLYGLDLGSVGATFVMDGFRQHVNWDCSSASDNCESTADRDKGLISFFFGIGATIGSLVNPYFAERYGRRPSLALSTLIYAFGSAIQTFAPSMQLLWTGRFFLGTGIGMLSMVAPVYVAEVAPDRVRGSMGILYDLSTALGIVTGSAASIGLKEWQNGWRISYEVGLPFALLLLLTLALKVVPESPRWLAAQGPEQDLVLTLKLLRFEEELESETETLHKEVQELREIGEASWPEVFSTNNMMRRRVMLGVFFFAIQQLSGVAAVLFYAPDVLNTFFEEDQAILGTLALTVLGFLSTTATVVAVDRLGRTKLLVYGGAIMFLCLVPLAVLASLEQSEWVGWAVLVLSGIFIVSSFISWGPALYVLCSEMFPYRTRGKANGVTSMSHWLFASVVGAVFPIASSASLSGCFIFFAICIFSGTSAVYFLQVETTGKTFAEIDEAFLQHKPTFKRKDW
ncbi:affinity glucose transporter [Seminavis robusta]|uniref:Hexose transporter 1 n=1 Tax=Seminavis robusta TaxID=568900 RepID=A0A9N8E2V7_9STRA|nr:affinity glucose transporter [Seminavis robusta]|eukprot:Sro471_g149680.1 affinity glucose transporter (524) ;mRNA; r:23066-24637